VADGQSRTHTCCVAWGGGAELQGVASRAYRGLFTASTVSSLPVLPEVRAVLLCSCSVLHKEFVSLDISTQSASCFRGAKRVK